MVLSARGPTVGVPGSQSRGGFDLVWALGRYGSTAAVNYRCMLLATLPLSLSHAPPRTPTRAGNPGRFTAPGV